jgi:hypothetical protein
MHDGSNSTELSDKFLDTVVSQDVVLRITAKYGEPKTIISFLRCIADRKKDVEGETVIWVIEGQGLLWRVTKLLQKIRWESFIFVIERSCF